MRFAVGDATIDVIVDDDDFVLPLPDFLPGYDPALLAAHRGVLEPEFLDIARKLLRFAIQAFVLRVGERAILIDTCIGDDKDCPEIPRWHRRHGSGFLDRLRQAGVDAADIDLVFCTHLHVDHVGWNTQMSDGRWLPTFPNARYLFGRRELADWMAQRDRAPAIHVRALEQSVIPIVEAGRAELVDDGHELHPGLQLVPLPGHTHGQMGVMVERAAGRAIFCGDALHSPLQILQPGLSTAVCVDPRQASATRETIFAEAAESGRLVVPAHFRGARRVQIVSTSSGYAPVPGSA